MNGPQDGLGWRCNRRHLKRVAPPRLHISTEWQKAWRLFARTHRISFWRNTSDYSARRGCADRRSRIQQRDPYVGIGLRLALDESVAGLPPQQYFVLLIVEHVITFVGCHRQHSM